MALAGKLKPEAVVPKRQAPVPKSSPNEQDNGLS